MPTSTAMLPDAGASLRYCAGRITRGVPVGNCRWLCAAGNRARFAGSVHSALPDGFRQNYTNGAFHSRIIVADSQLHAAQPGLRQTVQQLLAARGAFPIRQFDGRCIAAPFPVNGDGHQHRLAAHRAIFAHLFIAGIQDQIRIVFQPSARKLLQFLIQLRNNAADCGRAEFVPQRSSVTAFSLPVDMPRKVHLHHGHHQRLFTRW